MFKRRIISLLYKKNLKINHHTYIPNDRRRLRYMKYGKEQQVSFPFILRLRKVHFATNE